MTDKPETLEDVDKLTLDRLLELHRDHCCTFIKTEITYQKINKRCKKYYRRAGCDTCVADYIRDNWEKLK